MGWKPFIKGINLDYIRHRTKPPLLIKPLVLADLFLTGRWEDKIIKMCTGILLKKWFKMDN